MEFFFNTAQVNWLLPTKAGVVKIHSFGRLLNSRRRRVSASNPMIRAHSAIVWDKAAGLSSCTPERACFGMAAKHLVSVADLVNDLERGEDTPFPLWLEKLGLEGLLRERYPHTGR
jgi:hypothetical protein